MSRTSTWCTLSVVTPGWRVLESRALSGSGNLDLAVVDEIARAVLAAKRDGRQVVLDDAWPELVELLELTGLRVEVKRQAESGKESLWVEKVEEEAHPGDLSA